jgi:hypothetical protein
MKRLVLVAALLLSGGAFAQPQEVTPIGNISIGVGQTKVLLFDEPIGRIDVIAKNAVETAVQSDRQMSIIGTNPGETPMFVYSPQGKQLYSATVTVNPEPGHLVKIYGTGKNDEFNAGYIMQFCNELGCGRPDKDLPKPTIYSVERISRGR